MRQIGWLGWWRGMQGLESWGDHFWKKSAKKHWLFVISWVPLIFLRLKKQRFPFFQFLKTPKNPQLTRFQSQFFFRDTPTLPSLTKIRLTNGEPQEANLPSKPSLFLRQWHSGRRLDCQPRARNQTRRSQFYEDPAIPTEKMHIFGKVRKEMETIGVIPFLISGTLLGKFFWSV